MSWTDWVQVLTVGPTLIYWLVVFALKSRNARRKLLLNFKVAEEPHDPDPPKDPAKARISKADFKRTGLVRRYNIHEDGADPFRK